MDGMSLDPIQTRKTRTLSLMAAVDIDRVTATRELDPDRRGAMGQFLTPASVATFMASMFECRKPLIRLLDPGAGIGSLSAGFVAEMCQWQRKPKKLTVTAYEVDPVLLGHLQATFRLCRAECEHAGIVFEAQVVATDFIEAGARTLANDLLASGPAERFDCAILNPPYRKIQTDSRERKLLRKIGIETTNLYTGFLAVTIKLLSPGGEMVAITPRSFCNGPYFQPFRRFLLGNARFRRVHLFESRDRAFAADNVLQENVIFRAEKTTEAGTKVFVSSSFGPERPQIFTRTVAHDDLVRPNDPHAFIHIVPDGKGDEIRSQMARLESTLSDLGLSVSTGRVVDFRARHLLRAKSDKSTVPLIYPCHFREGYVTWPNTQTKKPNALALGPRSDDLLVPSGYYVLVKRFSAKEEPRRVVAAIYDPRRISGNRVAFENHLNYYHRDGCGLSASLARGLAAFLNSSVVDLYFRQFSGHTQVNATDLRSLRYPSLQKLTALSKRIGKHFPEQEALDGLIEEIVQNG